MPDSLNGNGNYYEQSERFCFAVGVGSMEQGVEVGDAVGAHQVGRLADVVAFAEISCRESGVEI